jgi:hypothetical protein
MGEDELVGAIARRGTTGEERRTQALERIGFWTGKRDQARAKKLHVETADCETKIAYWSTRLRALEERMAQEHPVTASLRG